MDKDFHTTSIINTYYRNCPLVIPKSIKVFGTAPYCEGRYCCWYCWG